jgi:hypothetical protein
MCQVPGERPPRGGRGLVCGLLAVGCWVGVGVVGVGCARCTLY